MTHSSLDVLWVLNSIKDIALKPQVGQGKSCEVALFAYISSKSLTPSHLTMDFIIISSGASSIKLLLALKFGHCDKHWNIQMNHCCQHLWIEQY